MISPGYSPLNNYGEFMQIIRLSQLVKMSGLSKSTIWRLEKSGNLPTRIQLSKRSVGWDLAAIENFLKSCPKGGIRK